MREDAIPSAHQLSINIDSLFFGFGTNIGNPSMEPLSLLSERIAKTCQLIGGLSLILTILVTMSDVITRYLFRLTEGALGFTIKGSVELVSYLMLFTLLASFAGFIERSQIIVDVFTQKMPHKLKAILMGLFMMVFAIIAVIFVYGFYQLMQDAIEYGNVTQDLSISMVPIYAFGGFLSILLTIRAFIESLNIFYTGDFHNAEETSS